MLLRHGSRYPSTGDITSLINLQKSIAKHRDIFSNQTKYQWIVDWVPRYDLSVQGLLVVPGEEEHYHLGERFLNRFPEIFNKSFSPNLFDIQTTVVSR